MLFTVTLCYAGDWPQYLGPNRNGISNETGFDTNWSQQKPRILWRQSLGLGFGSAAVSQDKVYVLDRIDDERDVFRCFDIYTGRESWQYAYEDPGKFSFNGSRTTPTIHGDKAFCVGAMGTVHCFDLIGQKPLWSRDFHEDFDAELPMWAFSQSPVIYRDLVIVAPQCKGAGVVAYHCETGKIVWKTPRLCAEAGYVSPTLATIDGISQVIQITPYISPDYVEEEEEEGEEILEPSEPLVGKKFTVEFENETYILTFKTNENVHVSKSKAGQELEGEYWQEGEGVFIELTLLFMEGEYDGEVFDLMEVEEIEEKKEESEADDEEEDSEFEGSGIYGIDAKSGNILWNYKGFNCRWPIPPVALIGDGRILITGGYEAVTIMIQVKYKADKWQIEEIFRNKDIQSQINPAIFYDDHLFMIANCNQNKNGLMCVSLDGTVLWKTGRKPNFDRGTFLIADGKIFIVDGKRGDLYCVKALSQGYQELGRMKLLKSGKVWSPVALSNGMLVARDQKQILCVKLNLK
ncbi:MAG: outer membrane protein assembly factor BamB family protein [Candidatus Kariarchaeaceae archaeon]